MPLNLDISNYNYGTVPQSPVAEQNQTYFAYWNGIGGTGPEYIDGTAYFIKYLIDINGNVTNPESFTVADSPEAIALYNLKNNFEVGKRAIIKTLEPDPTQNVTSNAAFLSGTHRIAHIGKIVPILVTETGPNQSDYITTMSFGPTSTQILFISSSPATNVVNTTARFRYQGNEYSIPYNPDPPIAAIYDETVVSSPAWQNVNFNTKAILSSSAQTGTRIRFKFDMFIEETFDGVDLFPPFDGASAEIIISKNGSPFPIFPISTPNSDIDYISNPRLRKEGNDLIRNNDGGLYTTSYSKYFDYDANDYFTVVTYANSVTNNNNQLRVKGAPDRTSTVWYIEQEIPPAVSAGSTEVALISNVNMASSSYFIDVANYPNSTNGGYTVLTMSPGLTSMWNTGATQNLDPASDTFTFSDINIPFSDIKPGDFIRFEYKKEQTFTIFNINQVALNGESVLELSVAPSLSDLSNTNWFGDNKWIELDHFVIYRVLDDGLYITLDVPKNESGNAYTGLILPEFISEELLDKLETLTQDLLSREVIN